MSKISYQLIMISTSLIIFLAASCQESEETYSIEEEKMINILVDIHISEAAAQQGDISHRDSLRTVYYDQVFEIHEVSKSKYEADMELLKRDAERLTQTYDKVIEKLKERKEKTVGKKNEK